MPVRSTLLTRSPFLKKRKGFWIVYMLHVGPPELKCITLRLRVHTVFLCCSSSLIFSLCNSLLLHELWALNDIDAGGWHASCTCPSGMHLETQTLTGMCCVCTLADWQQSADLAGNSGLRCTRPLPCLLTSCLRLWQAELLSLYTRCFTPFW